MESQSKNRPAVKSRTSAPVVVIGAGLTGLSCAIHLKKAGIPVKILEASDQPGGRMRTDHVDGFLRDKKFLILDNDALFAKQFCSILEDAGVQVVCTAIQAPNMNAFAERWVLTVKRECLSTMILFGADCFAATAVRPDDLAPR